MADPSLPPFNTIEPPTPSLVGTLDANPDRSYRADERSGVGVRPVATAFFLSGASALVYQVSWQRILELQSGVGIYSVAMIVGAFMSGLGIGSHAGSRLSLRLNPRQALLAFTGLELGIATWGALSAWLYYDTLYLHGAWLYASKATAGVLHFLALFPPTALMGMSLPLLARAMVHDPERAGRTLGTVYGVNALGAAFGALLTPWVLVRFIGVRGALLVAASSNLAAGLGVLAFVRRRALSGREKDDLPPTARVANAAGRRPLVLWLWLYALSGFCALALEILWFRVIDVAVRSTAFTFGTVLSLYLLGTALGSLFGARRVSRCSNPLATFLTSQCLLLGYSALAVTLMARLPADTPILASYAESWRSATFFRLGNHLNLPAILQMYLGLPLFLFGIPTLLMGYSFPVLQRAVQDDARTAGRKVGLLQAANLAGCLAGSLVVGVLLLNWFGTTGTFRLVVGAGLGFAMVGCACYGFRSRFSLMAAVIVHLLLLFPDQRTLWLRLHGTEEASTTLAEDATGIAALTPSAGGEWGVWINGKNFGGIPYGGFHTLLGALPAVIHDSPRDIAIIGLGSGDTAWAAGCRADTKRVRVFEICGPNLAALRELHRAEGRALPQLGRLLEDRRVEHVVADGRNALLHTDQQYDLIEIDALWPTAAYAGNIYSVEFFSLCASRLKPGGVMCTWCPTPRVYAGFRTAFPYTAHMRDGQIVVGSNQPISMDHGEWKERLLSSPAHDYLGDRWARMVLDCLRTIRRLGPKQIKLFRMNQDLFPRDELRTP